MQAERRARLVAASQHAQIVAARVKAREEAEQVAAQAHSEAVAAAARVERWEAEARARTEQVELASVEYDALRKSLKEFERQFVLEHGRQPCSRSELSSEAYASYKRRRELLRKYPGFRKRQGEDHGEQE